jgi:hypothetical protein
MPRKKYGWRVAGFIFKGIGTLIIVGIIGILAWRIIDRSIDPKIIKTITPNEKLCQAYEENGDLLTIYTQKQNEYTQEVKNNGCFANGGTVFIKEAEQVQFVLRYNNSTLKHTAKKYYLDTNPAREENLYDVTLVIMYDLTPDNYDDNDGETPEAVRYERIFASDFFSHQKTLYSYRKFTFDGVNIDDSVLAVYADIYYVGDLNYEEDPYGTLLIYSYEDENKAVKMSAADRKAIEDFNK